jgi:CrcB protein
MIWYVAVGSAIGGASRYMLGLAVQQRVGGGFPVGTLIINITGSLLLGFLMRAAFASTNLTPEVRAFLTTGLCGGYTTFSTFSYETAGLLESGQYGRAGLYIVLSIVLSLAATFVGFALAQSMLTFRDHA